MVDFSHLKKLEVKTDKAVKYELPDLLGEPYLMVLPATEGNKPYFNAALRVQRKNRSRKNIDSAFIKQNRSSDKDLYAEHVVKGWNNVKDTQGKAVKFSIESAKQFLDALPNYIFDDMRDFCQSPQNFSGIDPEDTNEIAKN